MMLTTSPLVQAPHHVRNLNVSTTLDKEINTNRSEPQDLMEYLKGILDYDSIIILGYRSGSQPNCLFSSVEYQHSQSMQELFSNYYAYDPFYSSFINEDIQGVFKIEDMTSNKTETRKYRKQFKVDNELKDELAINLPLDKNNRIALYLRRHANTEKFSVREKHQLNHHVNHLKALCKKRWSRVWAVTPSVGSHNLEEVIRLSLSSLGSELLTTREHEVTTLALQGFDNKAIAEKLDISVATVKVHKKKIYLKFEISSIGELYQVFINHLVMFSSRAPFTTQPTHSY